MLETNLWLKHFKSTKQLEQAGMKSSILILTLYCSNSFTINLHFGALHCHHGQNIGITAISSRTPEHS